MSKVLCSMLVLLLFAVAGPSAGQVPPGVGVVLLAHGGEEAWNAQVRELARGVRSDVPVEVSFLDGPGMGATRIQEAAERLEAAGVREIVAIPLLVSSHSWFFEGFRYLAGEVDTLPAILREHFREAGVERPSPGVPLRLARGLDDAPELARVLADRARALAESPGEQALFLLAHGPDEEEVHARARWMENLRRVAERVRGLAGFRDVRVGLVPATRASPPIRAEAVRSARDLIELQHAATGRDVVVVPVLMGRGAFSEETIPGDLAGLPVAYSGEVLLPHPALSRWVESHARQTAADASR